MWRYRKPILPTKFEVAPDNITIADPQDDESEQEGEEAEDIVLEPSALPPQTVGKSSSQDGTTPRTSGRECKRPGWFRDFMSSYSANTAVNISTQIPMCYDDIDGHPEATRWYQAVNDELRALKHNQTWTLVKRPATVVPVPCKWVFL